MMTTIRLNFHKYFRPLPAAVAVCGTSMLALACTITVDQTPGNTSTGERESKAPVVYAPGQSRYVFNVPCPLVGAACHSQISIREISAVTGGITELTELYEVRPLLQYRGIPDSSTESLKFLDIDGKTETPCTARALGSTRYSSSRQTCVVGVTAGLNYPDTVKLEVRNCSGGVCSPLHTQTIEVVCDPALPNHLTLDELAEILRANLKKKAMWCSVDSGNACFRDEPAYKAIVCKGPSIAYSLYQKIAEFNQSEKRLPSRDDAEAASALHGAFMFAFRAVTTTSIRRGDKWDAATLAARVFDWWEENRCSGPWGDPSCP